MLRKLWWMCERLASKLSGRFRPAEAAANLGLVAGQKLGGRYELGRLLGKGTMGEVFAARDVDGADLAIKVLSEEACSLPDMRERFRREAESARKIRSPHVARVLAAGANGPRLWIAYERLFGETLERRLARKRVPPASLTTKVVSHVLRGLFAAHRAGVVHRDLKPANVFLESRAGREPRACLIDFGVAKDKRTDGVASSRGLTGTADTLGSLRYAAPEQIGAASEADGRADLYALGVIAFRMLGGGFPVLGKSAATMLVRKLHEPPLSLAAVTGAVWPEAAEAFFARALATKPSKRFATAQAMLEAWEALTSAPLPSSKSFDPVALATHDPDDFQAGDRLHDGSTVAR
jgi:serine/threonine-protein kinase